MNVAHTRPGSAVLSVWTRAAWPARNQASRSGSAAPPRRMSSSGGPSSTVSGQSVMCLAAHRWM